MRVQGVRLGKRGRRIGYNWWREHNCELLASAEAYWQGLRESGQPIHSGSVPGATYDTAYYQLSDREFKMIHPRPTLKDFLIQNKGMGSHSVIQCEEHGSPTVEAA